MDRNTIITVCKIPTLFILLAAFQLHSTERHVFGLWLPGMQTMFWVSRIFQTKMGVLVAMMIALVKMVEIMKMRIMTRSVSIARGKGGYERILGFITSSIY